MNISLDQKPVECWIDVLGYEGLYQVSNQGKVMRNNKELKQSETHRGYKNVTLSKLGKVRRYYVHILVAQAFLVQDKEERKYVNHKDGNKSNNSVENLEWVTHKENHIHAKENGLHCRGEDIPWSILKKEDIVKIFDLHDQGLKPREIATNLNTNSKAVTSILRGDKWGWVCPDRHKDNMKIKVTPEVEKQIIQLYTEDYLQKDIAKKLDLSQVRVSQILRKNGIGKGLTI